MPSGNYNNALKPENNLSDVASASTSRTSLGLGSLATQSGTFSGTSSGTNTGDQNVFTTIAVSGQSDVVADSTSDTLTLVAGTNITITTSAGGDSVTIAASGGGGIGGSIADTQVAVGSGANISGTVNLTTTINAAYHRLNIGAAGCYVEAADAGTPGTFENLNVLAVENLDLATTAGGINIAAGNSLTVIQNLAVWESAGEVWIYPNDSASLVMLKTKDATGGTGSTTATVTTGDTVDGNSGSTTISTGGASGTGATGNLILTTGVPNSGTRGNIIAQRPLIAEPVANGAANDILVRGGANDSGDGGDVRVRGGIGTGGANGRVIVDSERGLYGHSTADDPLWKINSENSVVGIRKWDGAAWNEAYSLTDSFLYDNAAVLCIDLLTRKGYQSDGTTESLNWSAQQAAIADITGGAQTTDLDVEARAAIDLILAVLRAYKIIAP